jgi:hypothetical protein
MATRLTAAQTVSGRRNQSAVEWRRDAACSHDRKQVEVLTLMPRSARNRSTTVETAIASRSTTAASPSYGLMPPPPIPDESL